MAAQLIRAIPDLGSAAVWFLGMFVGLLAVFTGYIGLVLVAALKAETPELQRYRAGLLRDLLRFVRDLLRGEGKQ